MNPIKIAAVIGGIALIAGGGVGAKFLLDGQPATLEGESGYKGESDEEKKKLGYKYKSHLLSTANKKNDSWWTKRVKDLAESNPETTVEADGFFKTSFSSSFNTYKTEKKKTSGQTDLETKLKEAVDGLKKDCKTKYGDTTDTTPDKTGSNAKKWNEFWKFCSLNQEDPTKNTSTTSPGG